MKQVKDIMTTQVILCEPSTPVKDAAELLVENHISALPVVDQGKLVGILGEKDLLKMEKPIKVPEFLGILGTALYLDNPLDGDDVEKQIKEMLAQTVSEVMNTEFKTIAPEADTHEAAQILINENTDMLPVLENEKLVGVITNADIVKLLSR